MLIYNAVVHPMDAPTLPTGFVEWAEGKSSGGPCPNAPRRRRPTWDARGGHLLPGLSTPTAIWGCWRTA